MSYANGPKIVTDGLIYCLDAANRKSYPGSGSSCYDLSGNGNTGTLSSVSYSSSKPESFIYNANTDLISVPMINLRPSYITQEVFFKSATTAATQVFIGAQYGSAGSNSYALWYSPPYWRSGVNIGGTFTARSTSSNSLNNNTWYHFCATYDGSNEKTYVNGVEVMSYARTGTISYDSNNTLLAIGNDWNSGYDGGAIVGMIGDLAVVRIYNRGLTANEVEQNYNALKGRYGLN